MSRNIGASNVTEVTSASLYEVKLVKLEFDEPVYVHSSIGDIVYDSNTYLGVGHLGAISQTSESELLGPKPITLELSGINAKFIREALDAGSYGDKVTIYTGYRQDDGTLVANPFVEWRGKFEYATIRQGNENVVQITCQHDLAVLNEKPGGRYTDEEQQARYSGDTGFQFVSDQRSQRLLWGGGTVGGANPPAGGGPDRYIP